MVPGGDHCAGAIDSGWQTAFDHSLQETLAVPGIVDALKEGEFRRIGRSGRLQLTDVLHRDVTVANDVSVVVEVLRRGIVVRGRVDEETGLEVYRLHRDVEGGVGGDLVARLRIRNHRRDHVLACRDPAHGDAVARPRRDLYAVGELLARTEIDEVCIIAGAALAVCHGRVR